MTQNTSQQTRSSAVREKSNNAGGVDIERVYPMVMELTDIKRFAMKIDTVPNARPTDPHNELHILT